MINETSTRPKPTGAFRRAAACALVASAIGLSLAGAAQPAGAWAWDPNVMLQGRAIVCSRAATWVWVEASNGERGWATRPGGNYSFQFRRIPPSGVTVRVNFGHSSCSRSTSFGLKRPAVGTSATRDVVTIW